MGGSGNMPITNRAWRNLTSEYGFIIVSQETMDLNKNNCDMCGIKAYTFEENKRIMDENRGLGEPGDYVKVWLCEKHARRLRLAW